MARTLHTCLFMKKGYLILLTALSLIFLTENGLACSVCNGGGSQEELNAYLLTTGILGAMPIILGIFLFFLIHGAYKATNTKPAR